MDIKNEIQTRQIHRNGRPGTTHSRSLRVSNRHSKAPIPTQYPGDQLALRRSQIYAHTHTNCETLTLSLHTLQHYPVVVPRIQQLVFADMFASVLMHFWLSLFVFVRFCFAFFVFSPFFMQFCCCQDQHRESGLQQEEYK